MSQSARENPQDHVPHHDTSESAMEVIAEQQRDARAEALSLASDLDDLMKQILTVAFKIARRGKSMAWAKRADRLEGMADTISSWANEIREANQ